MLKFVKRNIVIYRFLNWYPGMLHYGNPVRTRYHAFWESRDFRMYQSLGFVVTPKVVREWGARSKRVSRVYLKTVKLEPQLLIENASASNCNSS